MTKIRSVRDLGTALRLMRKALRLTQADLALAAGVGLRFVVELEAGKPTVQLELVLRVIDALGGTLHLDTGRHGEDSNGEGICGEEISGEEIRGQ